MNIIGNNVIVKSERCNIFQLLNLYYLRLQDLYDSQVTDEDFKSRSNKQYEYSVLLYAYRLAAITAYLLHFNSYSELSKKYKLDSIDNTLRKRGISFKELLLLHGAPKENLEDIDVSGFQISKSPIINVVPKNITVYGGDDIGIPVVSLESFLIITANIDMNETQINSITLKNKKNIPVYSSSGTVNLEFEDFYDAHPCILIPASKEILTLRQGEDIISSGLELKDNIYYNDEIYKVYRYVHATYKDFNNKLDFQIEYADES